MKKAARSLYVIVFGAAFILSSYLTGHAQNREKFVISAKAGGINAVTGRPTMHGRGNSDWQQLSIKDDLEAGDVVKTGADGRVEVLLNPGSYLRVAEDSEFELVDNSLENLEIRLIRGTAIVEATGADDTELLINITTPHTKMAIIRRGLYRVNVVPGDVTELIVRKGRVLLAHSQTKVKGGTKMIFSATTFSVAKLEKADKKNVDNFEGWSKQRGEAVAQANRKIQGRDLNLLLSSFNDDWSGRFSRRSSGLWFFNARAGCFTFLPFYLGWGSPYGGSYSSAFYGGYSNGSHIYGGGSSPAGSVPTYSGRNSGVSSGGAGAGSPSQSPSSQPMPTMREIPSAAAGKVQRVNDPQP